MKQIIIYSLILSISLLFIYSNAQESICCGTTASINDFWFLQTPADTVIECHRSILNIEDYGFPDINGWAWELNGCETGDSSFCSANSRFINRLQWCLDDDIFDDDAFNDACCDPDDGDSTNDVADSYSDVITTPGCGNTQLITRTWSSNTVCAAGTAPITGVQTITIADTLPPQLSIPSDIVYECTSSSDYNFGSGKTFDMCSPSTDLSFNDVTLQSDDCVLAIGRTYTAVDISAPGESDECFVSTASHVVVVLDNTPPVAFFRNNIDEKYSCDNIPSTTQTQPIAFDDCFLSNSAPSVFFQSTEIIFGNCAGDYVERRTYAVVDTCDNADFLHIDISIVDEEPPALVPDTPSFTRFVACRDDVEFPVISAVDSCSNDVVVTNTQNEFESTDNIKSTTLTRTITATDDCGNSVTRTYTFIVGSESDYDLNLTGPAGPVTKGALFSVGLEANFFGCTDNFYTIYISVGVAQLQPTPICSQSATGGLVTCDAVGSGITTLNFVVPSDFLGSYLLINAYASETQDFLQDDVQKLLIMLE